MPERDTSAQPHETTSATQVIVDGLAFFDWVEWLDRGFGVWFRRRWGQVLARSGVWGLFKELVRTAAGRSSWRFAVPREGGLSGWEIEQMLATYGVRIWGRWFDSEYLYFNVKIEQANWAEYLLKRRGIAVITAPYNPLNDLYPKRHPPGSMPTPWRDKKEEKG
jgi:hypothetical protein